MLFNRVVERGYEPVKGEKCQHRSIEEKLRKYEVRAEGYEFVPSLMHVLRRYLTGVPEDAANEVDRRLARALDELPEARALLQTALDRHDEIPYEVKRRAFSGEYLNRPVEQPLGQEELGAILERAALLENRSVRMLASSNQSLLLTPSAVKLLSSTRNDGCCCPPPVPPKQPPPPPPVRRNQYEVSFSKLYCVDESDPEWAGSDEPYVVFGVITEEMAESSKPAVGVHSPVYGDVDDGDTRPESGDENLRLFGFTGPRAIDTSVLFTASCFENDLGNPEETTNAIRAALTAVATKAAAAGGYGWIVAGVAVVGIGVTYLVDLVGADDGIGGTRTFTLAEAEADARTAAVNPSVFAPLHFDGGDDDGIYDVYLKLRRA